MTSKSLNPKAEEWKPLPPHLSSPPPPPPPPLHLVAYTPLHLPKHPHFHTITIHPHALPHLIPFHFIYPPITHNQAEVLHGEEDLIKNPAYKKKLGKKLDPNSPLTCLPPRILMTSKAKIKKKKNKNQKSDNGVVSVSSSPSSLSPQDFLLSGKTTVMIKNIPNQLRKDDMVKFLDQHCQIHSLKYDFLYLPMDFRSKYNLGYAFVNFTDSISAVTIMEVLQNYCWGSFHTCEGKFLSKKICEVTEARIQGKEELVASFEHSNFTCDRMDFLPVVFDPPRDGLESNSVQIVVGKLRPCTMRKMKK